MKPAIRVEGLAKKYRIGTRSRDSHETLRDTISESAAALWRKLSRRSAANATEDGSEFWALKDVSFDVQPGEVVGIIGRNGAGKSTLLKILSRIVEPTAGRCEVRGRMASLLEVGTGFHPELTGRENVYLNGSLLGMSHKEIERKFDEIVAFSEIEQFLDTPVKRYSSGMYVRLAFAVAAHLEPEILVVDEVLAVGDVGFQARCINKMGEVSKAGRTVILVSHHLASIQTLCDIVIRLERGKILGYGDAASEIASYLASMSNSAKMALDKREDREGNGLARITHLRMMNEQGREVDSILVGQELRVALGYTTRRGNRLNLAALSFWSAEGRKIFHVDSHTRGIRLQTTSEKGEIVCHFPRICLVPGTYRINAQLGDETGINDHVFAAGHVTILPGDYYGTGKPTAAADGVLFVDHEWLIANN